MHTAEPMNPPVTQRNGLVIRSLNVRGGLLTKLHTTCLRQLIAAEEAKFKCVVTASLFGLSD